MNKEAPRNGVSPTPDLTVPGNDQEEPTHAHYCSIP
jgi:hypothetical protein